MQNINRSQAGSRAAASLLVAAILLAPTTGAQVERVEEIRYPELPRAERPAPQRFELENGMVVILIEDHELPLVEGEVAIRTGGRHEPAAKVGLAELTGTVLRSGGTTRLPSDELDDLLEDKAIRIETRIGASRGTATLSCLAEDLPETLQIFADILRNPAFEEEKLKVAKTQEVSGISRQNDTPQSILQREFREIVYGEDSPYARTSTYESIAAISRQDLADWHARYFHPNRIILGLVGDFETEEALELVRSTFGDWQRGPEVEEDAAAYRREPSPGVYFVEKNDVTQSNIRMGHLGIEKDHPDFYSVEVMNQVLGGSFASRLFSNVRSKKGLAYSVSGRVGSNYDYPGLALLSTSTKTETTGAAIEALLEEARDISTRPPSSEEVAKAKASILNSFVFRSDTSGEILGQQIDFEYYGYPLDWLERYRRGIENVTEEEVAAAAAEHLRPKEMAILVVGPSEGTDAPLERYGTVKVVDITIPEPPAPSVEIDRAGEEKAAGLISKALGALGGEEKVDRLESYRSVGTAKVAGPQGEIQAGVDHTVVFPDRMVSEMAFPFGTITQIFDGSQAFVKTPQGQQKLPESQAQELAKRLHRDPLYLLKQRSHETFRAAATGSGEVEGTPVQLVYVELEGEGTTLGIDPATGRILSRTYRGLGLTGAPGELRETRGDFRDVDGVELPFTTATTFEGEPMSSSVLESVELDVAVDDSVFQLEQ